MARSRAAEQAGAPRVSSRNRPAATRWPMLMRSITRWSPSRSHPGATAASPRPPRTPERNRAPVALTMGCRPLSAVFGWKKSATGSAPGKADRQEVGKARLGQLRWNTTSGSAAVGPSRRGAGFPRRCRSKKSPTYARVICCERVPDSGVSGCG